MSRTQHGAESPVDRQPTGSNPKPTHRVVCVSCGKVEVVPQPESPGHLCAECEAEQE
jgi:hypothetical protein